MANFQSETVWTGDNLVIMRGMNSESVDLIYLDPPFNSNRDYEAPIGSKAAGASFKDAWTLADVDVHEHGELADRNPAAYAVIEAARQAHGKGMQSYLIFMAVRLLEMHRLLKPTGSIYLHCDDAAGHYLKLLMDGIFGARRFRNAITWRRSVAHNDPSRYGRISDTLLFYTRGDKWTWNVVREPLSEQDICKAYPRVDENGNRFRADNLTGPMHGSGGGESAREWNGYKITSRGRVWSPPKTGGYAEYIEQKWIPNYRSIEGVHARLDELDKVGLVIHPKKGFWPSLKRYAEADQGKPLQDIIYKPTGLTNYSGSEYIGYPTQKPLALLDRILRASSNRDDTIFDPFCGCATTLVAADRLQRKWAGVDLSPLAIKLLNERIKKDRGELWGGGRTRWTIRRSARTLITSRTIARSGIACMESRKAYAKDAIRTFHSESWKLTTFCRFPAAVPIIQIICRSFAPAATEAKEAILWLSGGQELRRTEKSKHEQKPKPSIASAKENKDH